MTDRPGAARDFKAASDRFQQAMAAAAEKTTEAEAEAALSAAIEDYNRAVDDYNAHAEQYNREHSLTEDDEAETLRYLVRNGDTATVEAKAPVVDGVTVHTHATTYTVTCLPNDPRNSGTYDITVEFRGAHKWLEPRPADQQWAVILRGNWHLGHDGKWSLKPGNDYDGYDEWVRTHRFGLETALKVAAEQAPHVTVNGNTPAQLLAWRATR